MPDTTAVAAPDLSSALDSALSEDTTSTTETPVEAPENPATDAPADGSTPQETTEAAKPEEAAEEEWTDEEKEATPADEAGKNRIVAKNRFDALYRTYKQAKAIESVLGHVPTPEEAQQLVGAVADFELMQADAASGDPERAARFARHWIDTSGEAGPVVIGSVLDVAKEAQPELYAQIQQGMAAEAIEGLYGKVAALKTTSPEQYEEALFGVQIVDWLLRGDYLEEGDLAKVTPKQVDPKEARLAALEANEARRLSEQRRQAEEAFDSRLSSEMASVRDSAMERALAGVSKAFEGRQKTLGAIRDSLMRAALTDIDKDSVFVARFNAARDRAFRSGADADVQAVARIFSDRLSLALRQHREGIVREVTSQLSEQNKATHDALARSAEKKEPRGGVGAAAPVSGDRFKAAVRSGSFEDAFAALGLD